MVRHKKTTSLTLKIACLITTFFGVGKMPIASGTWGSLSVFVLFFAVIEFYPDAVSLFIWNQLGLIMVLLLYITGVYCTSVYQKRTRKKDAKEIVIDEVTGQWLTLVIVSPVLFDHHSTMLFYVQLLTCLILFRFFDISKPSVIGRVDRHLSGAHGVMLDDILAGFFAGIVTLGSFALLRILGV